jgi:hypothetical protein
MWLHSSGLAHSWIALPTFEAIALFQLYEQPFSALLFSIRKKFVSISFFGDFLFRVLIVCLWRIHGINISGASQQGMIVSLASMGANMQPP